MHFEELFIFDMLYCLNYNRVNYGKQYLIIIILPLPYSYKGEKRLCAAVYYTAW